MESYLKYYLTQQQNRFTHHDSVQSLVRSVAGSIEEAPSPILEQEHPPVIKQKEKEEGIDDLLAESFRYVKKKKKNPVYKETQEESPIFQDDSNQHIVPQEETFYQINESVDMQQTIDSQKYYKLYRDKDEVFECKISVEGTTLSNAVVRLILESEPWNLVFNGKIYTDGRCVVPLKKMVLYPEGTIGKARLEVIVDDVLFVPWEEAFKVEGAKKITVEVKPQTKISLDATPFENRNI